jgi:hypothetical protein
MKKRTIFRNLYWALTVVLLFSTSVPSQNQTTVMPGPGWQVIKADWGSGNRWMDVTNRVRVLLSGNGMVQVTNSSLGGDPAQGTVKVLRIQARNSQDSRANSPSTKTTPLMPAIFITMAVAPAEATVRDCK